MGVADVFRAEWPRLVATLMRDVGDLTIAEDAAQDAFIEASTRWPADGVPERPGAWLVTTGRRKAIDQIRRMRRFEDRLPVLAADVATVISHTTASAHVDLDGEQALDDQLALMVGCCHPALAPDAQVALTLRIVAGLSTPQIARAFLVSEETMARRLTRAKSKVQAARIPFDPPNLDTLQTECCLFPDCSVAFSLQLEEGRMPQKPENTPTSEATEARITELIDSAATRIAERIRSAAASDDPPRGNSVLSPFELDELFAYVRSLRQQQVRQEHGAQPVSMARVIAENLKRLRESAGWTQREMADAMQRIGFVGWERITVAEVESMMKGTEKPKRRASIEELMGYAAIFSTTVIEILTDIPIRYGGVLLNELVVTTPEATSALLRSDWHHVEPGTSLNPNVQNPGSMQVTNVSEAGAPNDWRPAGRAYAEERAARLQSTAESVAEYQELLQERMKATGDVPDAKDDQ